MKISILGTGIVGISIATYLLSKGHVVLIGSRNGKKDSAVELMHRYPGMAHQGTFTDAALFAPVVFNCVMGIFSLEVARMAGVENLAGKIVIDTTNPADFSLGMPPRLTICNDNSAGEMLQAMLPQSKIVKAFNTIPYEIIVDPDKVNNKNADMFICGNDNGAKGEVTELIVKEFRRNRENIIDLNDIKHARSTEALLLFFTSVAMRFGSF